MSYGKHLMLMISDVENIERLNDEESIKNFLVELVDRIKMRVLVQPAVGYEDGDITNVGYSGVVILYESHIAVHVYSGLKKVFLDVFSCKDYDEKEVYKFIAEKVGKFKIEEQTVLNRGRHWEADIEREMKMWREQR